MQEHQVTAGGATYQLPDPFFVLATQNPIEQEGTYPLPEAQLDRFMFEIRVGYPSRPRKRRSSSRPPARSRGGLHAGARRRVGAGDAGAGAADSGEPGPHPRRGDAGPDDPPGRCRRRPPSSRSTWTGAPGPARRSTWCSAPRRGRRWPAGPWPTWTTCGRWRPAVLRHRVVTNFAAEAADRTSEDLVRELVGGKGWLGS